MLPEAEGLPAPFSVYRDEESSRKASFPLTLYDSNFANKENRSVPVKNICQWISV